MVHELIKNRLTLSFAESITGGMLASCITSVSGASAVFKESYITYSDEAKIKNLGVDPKIIEEHGAVSKECALAMVHGLKKRSGADICVAVTGFAGPSTFEGGKVGQVFIAYAIKDEIFCEEKRYLGDRRRVQKQVTQSVLLKIAKSITQIA